MDELIVTRFRASGSVGWRKRALSVNSNQIFIQHYLCVVLWDELSEAAVRWFDEVSSASVINEQLQQLDVIIMPASHQSPDVIVSQCSALEPK